MQTYVVSKSSKTKWNYRTRGYGDQCNLCKKMMLEGEAGVRHTGTGSFYVHRACLEQFLTDNPAKGKAVKPEIKLSPAARRAKEEEEALKKFEDLRKKVSKGGPIFR